MFVITRNGKKTVRRTFDTYEAARVYCRKLARKTVAYQIFGADYRNPTLASYGYSVVKVNG